MKKLEMIEINELKIKLSDRFNKNINRHLELSFEDYFNKLMNDEEKLLSLYKMELTGGEPDVIGFDQQTNQFIVCDCSKETPIGRRSICYDQEALDARKNFKPENSAIEMAKEIGIKILSVDEYKYLQQLGDFDTKTSSWLLTPKKIRDLGGALFGDKRYDTVFTYHNGADSYYGVRGFRGILKV